MVKPLRERMPQTATAAWFRNDKLSAHALSVTRGCLRMNDHLAPNADINCRDCDVRSLAGPEPDRQVVFAKFKHLSRKAAARSSETIYVTIGEILRAFAPTECATGYAQS
jgi:hypothetical protein